MYARRIIFIPRPCSWGHAFPPRPHGLLCPVPARINARIRLLMDEEHNQKQQAEEYRVGGRMNAVICRMPSGASPTAEHRDKRSDGSDVAAYIDEQRVAGQCEETGLNTQMFVADVRLVDALGTPLARTVQGRFLQFVPRST